MGSPSDADLQVLVATLAQRYGSEGLRLAAAESCTGGWLAKLCTDLAGSSSWFDCGFVSYSNEAKQAMLGVAAESLAAHGAVSEAVVLEMVAGTLARSRADWVVAISGIAGPGGGSADKPVGTVWFAWGRRDAAAWAQCCHFHGDREAVRRQALVHALQRLIDA
jgi:nicotinamide-nucleotide amidase